MPLIVDAYNVLHVTGVLPPDLAGPDLDDLADLIRRSRFSHARTTLVCDGSAKAGRPGRHTGTVRITFSGPGRTADDLIVHSIRKSSDPRRLTVVTSDRAILREARKRRCETLSSEGFLRQIARDHEHVRPARRVRNDPGPDDLSPGQVRKWIETFAITDADLRPPDGPLPAEPEADDRETAPSMPAPTRAPGPAPVSKPPRKPLLPAALLAEAEELLRAEPPPPEAPSVPETPSRTPSDTAPPTARAADRPRADPLLPIDVLREAAAIEHGRAPARGTGDPRGGPSGRKRPVEPPKEQRPREVPLPPDIIAEAEALLRDDPPAPDDTDSARRDR